ncbi:MAG: hypothetical protein UH083_00100, partial [Ruminococcus sp.]|nr:hypothetical protein [Ruminococcus sp.]
MITYHQRRVRKGFRRAVAALFHNAAMTAISLSNVRFADWVKRHACGLPTAAVRAAVSFGESVANSEKGVI